MNDKYIDVLNIDKDIETAELELCYLNMDLMSLNKRLFKNIDDTKEDINILKYERQQTMERLCK